MKHFGTIFNAVLGAVNIIFFVFLLSIIRIEATQTQEDMTWRIDQIAFQITLLEVVFVLVGIVFAILGFFGFQLLLERAESRADSTAREAVQRLYDTGRLKNPRSGSVSHTGRMPPSGDLPVDDAEKEENV